MALRSNIEDFMKLDTPNLLINIWSYSEHFNETNCRVCGINRKYCIQIVKRRWKPEWGFFNKVIKNIKNNNEDFIDLSTYSSRNRYKIIADLKKIEEKGAQRFGVIY